jgi:hypothetical protein
MFRTRAAPFSAIPLATHGLHLLPNVIPQSTWVLRSVYRWPRARISAALLDTEGVTTREPARGKSRTRVLAARPRKVA